MKKILEMTYEEIECLLLLYPVAKRKHEYIMKCCNHNEVNYFPLNKLRDIDAFYQKIIILVEHWLTFLFNDEVEIIVNRFFLKKNYSDIAAKVNYKSHGSVIKKKKNILIKISHINVN